MRKRVRVVVVDDHPLLRAGLVATLNETPDMEVVAEASEADAAVRLARRLSPEIVLLDLRMPGGGPDAIRRLIEASATTRIVVLTASTRSEDMLRSVDAGAAAYVLKGVGGEDLVRVVRHVAAGGVYAPPELTWTVFEKHTDEAAPDPLSALSTRERDVLDLLASGLSDQQIGLHLGLSAKTVAAYLSRILSKLRLRSRVEAAVFGQRLGLGTGS